VLTPAPETACPAGTAQSNGIELHYEDRGEGPPVVLIMGIGSQRVQWPHEFLAAVRGRGLRTITYDNRDSGLSTWMRGLPAPNPLRMLSKGFAGLPTRAPYSLVDMAEDLAGLLDQLGIQRAHIAGISMGGMIAQTFAIHHPTRAASLISMHSTTGARRASLGHPKAYRALLAPRPHTREEAIQRHFQMSRVVGSKGFALDWEGIHRRAGLAYDIGLNPAGFLRQWAAIMHSGDRTARLRELQIPARVVHGTVDPLIPPRAGRATAEAIPGAVLDMIPGMGHDLPPGVHQRIADGIAETVAQAEAARPAA
jgi:pimeloyl-ACP methyl ester carboxylesterase